MALIPIWNNRLICWEESPSYPANSILIIIFSIDHSDRVCAHQSSAVPFSIFFISYKVAHSIWFNVNHIGELGQSENRGFFTPIHVIFACLLPAFNLTHFIMIDPFTHITGIAGLISLTIEVTKITTTFANSVKGAAGHVHDILSELVALDHVLQQLDNFLKTEDSLGPFAETCPLILMEQYCTVKVKQLYEKLRHLTVGGKLRRSLHALEWPYKESESVDIILSLHRCAQTFQLALTVDQWYAIFCFLSSTFIRRVCY